MKDVIKSDGEWVSSLQVEELIEQFPDVKEAAVISRIVQLSKEAFPANPAAAH